MNYLVEAAIEAVTWIACAIIALAIFFGVNSFLKDEVETCVYTYNDAGLVVESACR